MSTEDVTMAKSGSKHISRKGGNDKRSTSVTLSETIIVKILPFELVYTGKLHSLFHLLNTPNGFCLSYSPKHWSNEDEA